MSRYRGVSWVMSRKKRCETCERSRSGEYYRDNKDKYNRGQRPTKEERRKYVINSRYGFDFSEVEKSISSTKTCPICTEPVSRSATRSGKTPVIDHCHSTGEFRGILCSKCNSGIGFLGDSVENLKRAIRYLEGDKNEG